MDMGDDYLGPKVLRLESRGKGSHDLIPTARRFAQELRRLNGEGYDVMAVTIRGTMIRNDRLVVPKCNLSLVGGELLERE